MTFAYAEESEVAEFDVGSLIFALTVAFYTFYILRSNIIIYILKKKLFINF